MRHGYDKQGRPVLYMRPRFQNTKDYVNQVRLTVYNLERVMDSMDPSSGVEAMTLIIDFKDYSIWNAPPMSQTREVLHILTCCYPERLGCALLFDAPMLFTMAYKVIRPFLPPVTQEKVCTHG